MIHLRNESSLHVVTTKICSTLILSTADLAFSQTNLIIVNNIVEHNVTKDQSEISL